MRTTPAPNIEPGRPEIERAIRFLEREGDVQGVIRLVEAWERGGEVSLVGLLAQARAFLRLCLMDRAWVRLREASQQAPEDVEVLMLTARVFIARGWPSRALRLLEQVQTLAPDHPELEVLRARTSEPPPAPPANARELERSTDPRQLLALTESYLSSGSFLRARSLLERIKRLDPHNYRVDLLMWGVQGDFLLKGRTLADLVREASEPGDWDGAEHTVNTRLGDLGLADPPTAEASRSDLAGIDSGQAFPDLFRDVPGERRRRASGEDEEVTAAVALASVEEMQQPPEPENTDAAIQREELGGDTQIMQVIRKPGGGMGLSAHEGGIHQPTAGTEAPRDPLDLRAWQRSMGVAAAPAEDAPAESADYLEAEDEDLVVLTRREEGEVVEAPPEPPRQGPIEVVEKHPLPDPPAVDPFQDVETRLVPDPPRRSVGLSLGLIAAVMLVLVLVMGLTAWLTVRVLRERQARAELGQWIEDIETADAARVAELEASLRARVARGEGMGAAELALAQARIRLWEELEGGLAWRAGANEAIGLAVERGAPPVELAETQALFHLADGHITRAGEALAAHEEDAQPWLRARLALEAGEVSAARDVWSPTQEELALPGRALLVRRVLVAAGETEAADQLGRRLLTDFPDDAQVAVEALQAGFSQDPAAARASLLQERATSLGARQQARVLAHRAAELDGAGEQAEALALWEAAAKLDSGLEAALVRLAGQRLAQNASLEALALLDRCLLGKAASPACTRGRIQVLLDLDRVEEAAQALVQADRPSAALRAWVALQAEDLPAAQALQAELSRDAEASEDGLARLMLARVSALEGESEKAQRALWAAQQTLAASTDPFDRILAGRAAAERLRLAPDSLVEARASEALAMAPSDPLVLVGLADRLERAGQVGPASRHRAKAAALGPENGLAWYALAQRSEDADARRRYLALGPTGPRAERIRDASP